MELEVFEWNEKYSVGFKLIDAQHKQLFALYNKIVKAKKENVNPSPTVIREIVDELADYVHIHFLTEEEVMKAYGYPEFIEHKKKHDQFASVVDSLKNDFDNNEMILMDSVIKKIKNWLLQHVTTEDHKYKSFLTES